VSGDRITVRLSKVGACLVAVLAFGALSACGTKAGAAAFVGDDRISESEVTKYVDASYTLPATTDPTQPKEPPRVIALNTLIETRLMTELLAKSLGGVPSDAELAALHDEAYAVQIGIQQTGSAADAQMAKLLEDNGLKQSFAPVFTRSIELKQAVIDKIKAQQQSDIANAVNKLGVHVSVNGRYGSWSTADAGLAGYTPPDVVTLGSAAPAPTTG
jgi:hypothetical protein